MSQVSADMAIQFGLINGGGTAKTNPHVKVKGFGTYMVDPSGWAPGVSEQLRTHPQEFLLHTLMPKLDGWIKANIPGFDKMSPEQKSYEEIRLGSAISSRDPARAYWGELVALKGQVDRDVAVGKEQMKRDIVGAMTNNNAMVDIKALTAALTGFQIALSTPGMQQAIGTINSVSGAFNGLSTWSSQHAEATKTGLMAIEGAVIALGMGAGAAALTALGGAGGLIAGVGIGTALAVEELKKAQEWLQHTFPNAVNDKGLHQIQKQGGPQLPWWAPMPAGPGGRAPAPHWMEYLLHGEHANSPGKSVAPVGRPGAPLHVHVDGGQLDHTNASVVNGHDLVHGVASGIAHQTNRPPSGVTGHDPRIDLGSDYLGASP